MVKVPKSFVDDTLWPEYQQIAAALRAYIDQVADRVLAEVIHRDGSEPDERPDPPQLGTGSANVHE